MAKKIADARGGVNPLRVTIEIGAEAAQLLERIARAEYRRSLEGPNTDGITQPTIVDVLSEAASDGLAAMEREHFGSRAWDREKLTFTEVDDDGDVIKLRPGARP